MSENTALGYIDITIQNKRVQECRFAFHARQFKFFIEDILFLITKVKLITIDAYSARHAYTPFLNLGTKKLLQNR